MNITATEFNQVQASGETVTITKRGKVVAQLGAVAEVDEKSWLALRGADVSRRLHVLRPSTMRLRL